jgi:hypothetical protein
MEALSPKSTGTTSDHTIRNQDLTNKLLESLNKNSEPVVKQGRSIMSSKTALLDQITGFNKSNLNKNDTIVKDQSVHGNVLENLTQVKSDNLSIDTESPNISEFVNPKTVKSISDLPQEDITQIEQLKLPKDLAKPTSLLEQITGYKTKLKPVASADKAGLIDQLTGVKANLKHVVTKDKSGFIPQENKIDDTSLFGGLSQRLDEMRKSGIISPIDDDSPEEI